MKRSDLIQKLSDRAAIPQRRANFIIELIFEEMAEALINEDKIEIRNFGSFHIKHYPGYQGRNPRTGAVIQVGEKRLPSFKTGRELLRRVQSEPGQTED
jgi:integration host factor subunit beta